MVGDYGCWVSGGLDDVDVGNSRLCLVISKCALASLRYATIFAEAFEVKFSGMRDPQMNVPLIEVETLDGQLVDLYNENYLRCVVRRGDELVFEFDSTDRSMSTVLRFLGVRDLCVVQPEDWHPMEADQIHDYMVRTPGPWRRIVFKAGGLEYEFNAAELRVVIEQHPMKEV